MSIIEEITWIWRSYTEQWLECFRKPFFFCFITRRESFNELHPGTKHKRVKFNFTAFYRFVIKKLFNLLYAPSKFLETTRSNCTKSNTAFWLKKIDKKPTMSRREIKSFTFRWDFFFSASQSTAAKVFALRHSFKINWLLRGLFSSYEQRVYFGAHAVERSKNFVNFWGLQSVAIALIMFNGKTRFINLWYYRFVTGFVDDKKENNKRQICLWPIFRMFSVCFSQFFLGFFLLFSLSSELAVKS